ncbi:MAG: hypothetical protein WBB29_00530 [Geitlerinemataceae cyanobacterium]
MNTCPCCSNQLLRHIRHNRGYWFCQNCWQEMPDLQEILSDSFKLDRTLISSSKIA